MASSLLVPRSQSRPSMWLVRMFTDGVKEGRRAGGRDDERDVKHEDHVRGTKRI